MRFWLLHPADQLVMMMRRIYERGMTTTSGGNLSIRDRDGELWITPGGIDKAALTTDDIVRVAADGGVSGRHKPSSEYPFHLSVYRHRSDIGAVLHAHSPALVAFSIARALPDINLIPTARLICGNITMAPYALPGSETLGEYIAAEFKDGYNVVMLENHGVVIGAKDIFQAFMAFETLEFCARLHLSALALGIPRPLKPGIIAACAKRNDDMSEFSPKYHTSEENAVRRDLIRLIRRSYGQGLFTSTQGIYSARAGKDAFVITPFGMDRQYLEAEDLVLIQNGQKETGKHPSRSVHLHEEIYAQHPKIESVLIAHPPAVMAFAVTDAEFDTRTIPESYILLREVKKAPFGTSYRQPKKMAAMFSAHTPVVICENDCVMVTGSSLLNAFDRLEVAEFTAKSLISSKALGGVVPIRDQQIEEINAALKLT